MSRRRVLGTVLILAIVGAVVIGVWWWRPKPEPAEPALTTEELRELSIEASRGLALLENERVDEAIPILERLRDDLPEEDFGPRNLAIAHLVRLSALAPDDPDRERVAEEARRAGEALIAAEASAEAHVLAARIATAAGDDAGAVREYERALAIDEKNAATWFEFARLPGLDADGDADRIRDALERAHEAAPNNVFVLLDLMLDRLNRRDAELIEAVERLSELVAPYAAGIEKWTNANVVEIAADAVEALKADDWRTASRHVRILVNVTRPTAVSQADRRRIDRNPLEFVRSELGAEFYSRPEWEPWPEPEPIEVRFEGTPVELAEPIADPRAVLVRDVDLDERPDIVVLGRETLVVLLGTDDGFVPGPTLKLPGEYAELLAADLDADVDPSDAQPVEGQPIEETCVVADLDFVLCGAAGCLVVRNDLADDGSRSLVVVPANEVLSDAPDAMSIPTTTMTAADIDHDGQLDLVLGCEDGLRILSSRGDTRFEDVTARSSVPSHEEGDEVTAILPVDLDNDVDLDLVVVRSDESSGWMENLRHGSLRWEAVDGLAVGGTGWLADTADSRGWAIDVATGDGVSARITDDSVPGRIVWGEESAFDDRSADGGRVWDFDNDGVLDRLLWGAFGVAVLRGERDGGFDEMADAIDIDGPVVACDVGDLDDDGDLDLVVLRPEGVTAFVNVGGNAHGWLRIALKAQQVKGIEISASGRVNQHGIGSLIEFRSGPIVRRHVVDRPWTHLGVGDRNEAEAVRVLWTNGIPFNAVDPGLRLAICEKQTLKGSCPYLYAWDGERFAFVTDLLWASPIGLQFADGVLAPAREWEHLLVPGRFVAERDGEYHLRITEELWEVAYFDHVELVAVDHPAEFDVFTNEKVGPAEIAEHRIRTVTQPRTPAAIRDGRGNDLLPQLRARDEEYGRTFERRLRQGLADEHVLEIDLGLDPTESPERLTLFLGGWVFPSDTSLNVALSRDPTLPSPRPPRLEVPDGDGGWRTAIPYTGFPGGKTKTIAIDLTDVVPLDDPRVRLVTNMEFAWDHVFFTVDEPDRGTEIRETPLPLASAELAYRGFSREDVDEGFGPHRYDYEDVSTTPKWPPIAGGFTRYGDVLPLLAAEDDRLVILGAGDEIRLRFRVPERQPPEGWVRDFVIRNVGWDKDADLNTVHGSTVEPLPFRGMPAYPLDPPAGLEALRAADRDVYHRRSQSASRFRHSLSSPSRPGAAALAVDPR